MMGRNRNAGKPGAKNPGKTFKRIFAEIMSKYKVHCIAVVICLLISAVANVYGTMFMQRLIDDYITPMMGQPNPDFGPMGRAVLGVAAVYILGAFSAWLYNYLMIFVSQGIGGGICQVSSTLYNAVVNAGLTVNKRTP